LISHTQLASKASHSRGFGNFQIPFYYLHMSKNDLTKAELKQLISAIVFFQLGARTKELKTIKFKLKNQLKEMESNGSS